MAVSSRTAAPTIPMRDEIIAAMDCDWQSVMASVARRAAGRPAVWYQKHMWHHMTGPIGYARFRRLHPRLPDPRTRADDRLLSSQARSARQFEDFGMDRQAEFFERESDRLGHAPPVIDANDVLADPKGVLSSYARARHRVGPGNAQLGAWAAAKLMALGRPIGMARREKHRLGSAGQRPSRAPDDCSTPSRALPSLLRASRGVPAKALTVTR